MRKHVTIYECDNCKRVLSDGKVAYRHISLAIGDKSGCVRADSPTCDWIFLHYVQKGVYHFCGTDCLSRFFQSLATGEKGYK